MARAPIFSPTGWGSGGVALSALPNPEDIQGLDLPLVNGETPLSNTAGSESESAVAGTTSSSRMQNPCNSPSFSAMVSPPYHLHLSQTGVRVHGRAPEG